MSSKIQAWLAGDGPNSRRLETPVRTPAIKPPCAGSGRGSGYSHRGASRPTRQHVWIRAQKASAPRLGRRSVG
jgi:hypothetical protein